MKRFLLLFALVPSMAMAQATPTRTPTPTRTATPTRTPSNTPTSGPVLIWDPPTTRLDGTPLKDGELKEYRLYNKRALVKVIPVPTVSAPVTMQGNQNYAWEVTAVDQAGRQSDYSNALVFQATPIPTLAWPPGEPGSLRTK